MLSHNDSYEKEFTGEDSIVVLPFRNMSSDKENEYFSDGITEELINALTKVDGLNVIARTSAFTFKGKDIDLREVGAQLNVSYILEGSVRKSGERVRVSVQLIKASDSFHIFSEVYDRELKDIFQVQDDISKKVVQKFTEIIGLPKTDKHRITSSTDDVEAYDLYLKGRFNLSKGSLEAAKAAIQYFDAALKKDSDFVLPLTGLSACYTFLGGSGLMSKDEAFDKAKQYALKTTSLDDSIAETHLALANSFFWHDWDFENAGASIKKAIQLSPGTSSIHGFNAVYLMAVGKMDEALIEAGLAIKLDPLSLKEKFHLGEILFRSERYVEAIEIFNQVLTENPFFKQASILKAWGHLFMGEMETAEEIFLSIPVTAEESITFYGGLAMAFHKRNNTELVLDCLKGFKSAINDGYSHWLNYNYTLIYRALCETERMFEFLSKCLDEKLTPLIFIQADPVWNEFRDDARFIELVKRTFDPGKKDRIITINADTNEKLEINLRQLVYIEAQENYSRIVWLDDGRIKDKLLRATLKNIENQIPDSNVLRCHRSYMINLDYDFVILGNSNGYRLKSEHFQETIPISRNLGKEIVARLR
ncbi:LytTR family transcriptional regulator DNA-binding domain-containing protein [Bacteroidota bacterium]